MTSARSGTSCARWGATTAARLERLGFYACTRDLEDELTRAVGPGREWSACSQSKASCRSETGRQRFRPAAVDEWDRQQHHAQGTEGGYLQRRSAVGDRRNDEIDDGGQARGQPDQGTQPLETSRKQNDHREGDQQPAKRTGPFEVRERVWGDPHTAQDCVRR